MNDRRLRKSSHNKMVCGVCSGIAEYFRIVPTIVRLIWAILILCYGTGLLAYIICAIVMPTDY